MLSNAELRKRIRAKRNALSNQQQKAHGLAVARHFMQSGLFVQSKRIALYRANDGELDLSYLEQKLLSYKKQVYLPAIRKQPRRSLWFIRYNPGDRLITNRFGIKEPTKEQLLLAPPWRLDLILMPLVAFDLIGNRIGMGGGYYDRALNFLSHHRMWRKPLLIGIGHECQRVTTIKAQPWDIPLDCAVTEAGVYNIHSIRRLHEVSS